MEITALITRNVDCSTITKDDFIKFMMEDLHNSKEEYRKLHFQFEKDKFEDLEVRRKESIKKRARIFTEKKWKTEAKRNAYVEQEMAKYVPRTFKFYGITYFDFHVEPWSNCLSNTFSIDKVTTENLGKCYDEIKENKYFKNAIGWILEDHHYSRPQIKLILPEEYEKMWKTDMENLGKAIGEFYKNTKYFGD